MFRKSDPPQQWSVHAEFTISHPGVGDPDNAPQTETVRDDNGVRMTYTWASNVDNTSNIWEGHSNTPSGPPSTYSESPSKTFPSGESGPRLHSCDAGHKPPYGFQRGNMLFTSIPPSKRPFVPSDTPLSSNKLGTQVQDSSGYGSDLLSPNSFASGSLPRRTIQPYNRKCRSTCNIVLSTNIEEQVAGDDAETSTQCGRTQSLRCQTPTARCDRKNNFYGCGDPWCHHLNYGDDLSGAGRFSPVLEMCEECPSAQSTAKQPSRASTFTTHCCEHSRASYPRETDRKDACVQTFEMIDKCTSPFMKMGSFSSKEGSEVKKRAYGFRRKTEPIHQRSRSPSTITPDSLDAQQSRRLNRSQKQKKIPSLLQDKRGSARDSRSSDPSKKPRTVHIDVYCTGTEMESNGSSSSSDSSDNETASTPQTVFESASMRVTHHRADKASLPQTIKNQETRNLKPVLLSKDPSKEESDDDNASTAYPSKLSSYSTIKDFSSSISSVPRSWTSYSMSSCTVPDDYDSVANTSWKDTFSDIDSLLQSRSSIAQTDSLDFVPRRMYEKTPSIDEAPQMDRKRLLDTASVSSLQQSDSFEYANSEDRMRIRRMEDMLAKQHQRPWKSPQLEKRQLIRQKKINDYVERKLSNLKQINKSKSKESDSDDDDEDEKGWTFIKDDSKKLERDSTVRRASKDFQDKIITRPETILEETVQEKHSLQVPAKATAANQGSPNDSSPSSSKSPSSVALLQRMNVDPTLRSPFSILPGLYTEQRYIARRFGPVVSAFRKPGHHVGPAKNPDCMCDHCRRYFEEMGCRTRTRSLGDPPTNPVQDWREFAKLVNPTKKTGDQKTQLFKDF